MCVCTYMLMKAILYPSLESRTNLEPEDWEDVPKLKEVPNHQTEITSTFNEY